MTTSRRFCVCLLIILALPGCRQLLDIPSDLSAPDGGQQGDDDGDGDGDVSPDDGGDGSEGDGAASDASPDPDGSGGGDGGGDGDGGGLRACGGHDRSISFDDPAELDNWLLDFRQNCDMAIEGGRLVARQPAPPGFCRMFRELSMDVIDYGLQIAIADPGDEQVSMVYSLILSDGTEDIRYRRRLRIERNDGLIKVGECVGEACDTDVHGSFPLDPARHMWWRFDHDSDSETIHFEFAGDDENFTRPPEAQPVIAITRELVACVGVELGTYEIEDAGTAAFDYLAGGSGAL